MTYPQRSRFRSWSNGPGTATTRWWGRGGPKEGTVGADHTPAKWLIRKLASYLVGYEDPRSEQAASGRFRHDVERPVHFHLLPRGFSCVTTITMTFLVNGYSVRSRADRLRPEERGTSKFHWWSRHPEVRSSRWFRMSADSRNLSSSSEPPGVV